MTEVAQSYIIPVAVDYAGAKSDNGRVPELDGLRGLALLLVLLWHYVQNTVQVEPGTLPAYLHATLRLTWSGVDLFFVLSGFLIGGILLRTVEAPAYYRTFYWRRFYRIAPVYFIWLFIFLLIVYFCAPGRNSDLGAVFNRDLPSWAYILLIQNIPMSLYQTFGPQWLAVTWSLAVEEQFYLVLPFLMRHVRCSVKYLLSAVILAPLLRLALFYSGNIYFGPYTLLPCRADSLAFGVLTALAVRNSRLRQYFDRHQRTLPAALLGPGMIGLGILTEAPRHGLLMVTVGYTWLAAFYATLLLYLVTSRGSWTAAAFRLPFLGYLGRISYTVYITHQGLSHLLFAAILSGPPAIYSWKSASVEVLSFAIVLMIASLSMKYLEYPLLRHARTTFRYG